MTSTPCQSAALDRIIAPWPAKIAEFFGAIVETILTIAEIVRTTLYKLSTCCRKAKPLLALQPGLSRPMMPKRLRLAIWKRAADLPHVKILRVGLRRFGEAFVCNGVLVCFGFDFRDEVDRVAEANGKPPHWR